MSRSKGQLTILGLLALAAFLSFILFIVILGGRIGFFELERTVEVTLDVTDKGTGFTAFLGSDVGNTTIMEHLSTFYLHDEPYEDIPLILEDITEHGFHIELIARGESFEYSTPPPKHAQSDEFVIPLPGVKEPAIPVPGTRGPEVQGQLVISQW